MTNSAAILWTTTPVAGLTSLRDSDQLSWRLAVNEVRSERRALTSALAKGDWEALALGEV